MISTSYSAVIMNGKKLYEVSIVFRKESFTNAKKVVKFMNHVI